LTSKNLLSQFEYGIVILKKQNLSKPQVITFGTVIFEIVVAEAE